MELNVLFFNICDGEVFLNESFFTQPLPVLTSCFLDTFPTWLSCGFLWLSALPQIAYMYHHRDDPLPFSYLHLTKTGLCMVLACLAELHFTFRQMYGANCTGLERTSVAAQMSMWIKILTFLLAAALLQAQKRLGRTRSGVPFAFWFLMIAAELLQLYTYAVEKEQCASHTVFYVYFTTLVLQFVAHCWMQPGKPISDNKGKSEAIFSPRVEDITVEPT